MLFFEIILPCSGKQHQAIFCTNIAAYENPELVSQCGGIGVLLRKILDCHQYPRINESLVATILHLINFPSTRHYVRFNTDLEVSDTFPSQHWSFYFLQCLLKCLGSSIITYWFLHTKRMSVTELWKTVFAMEVENMQAEYFKRIK